MKRGLVVILLAGMFISVQKAQADDAKKEAKKLKGKWRVTTILTNNDGVTLSVGLLADVLRMHFSAQKVTIMSRNQGQRKWKMEKRTFKLDTSKTPHQIDIINAKKKATMYGIYKLNGNSLTLCWVESAAKDRPTVFKADGKNSWMWVLRRERN